MAEETEGKVELVWKCCFCAEAIPAIGGTMVQLIVIIAENDTRRLQAHLKCFSAVLHPSVPSAATEA